MTVLSGDLPVTVMNDQFGALISADVPSSVYGVLFGAEVPRGALSFSLFDVPAAPLRVRYYMGSLFHITSFRKRFEGVLGQPDPALDYQRTATLSCPLLAVVPAV